MSLPDFDTMKAMTDEELTSLYNSELEEILSTLPAERAARYRAMIGGKMMRLERIKNPYVRADRAFTDMMESFGKLNDLLQEAASNENFKI